jgi:hypothetical protein
MRHNRPMRSAAAAAFTTARLRCVPGLLMLVLAVAACQRPPPAPPALSAADAAHPHLRWQGTRRCADCAGIDVQLLLFRAGGDTYALTETFHAGRRAARFEERGHWQREGAQLQLRGDGGSLRAYALLPDGRLQPRDLHGDPLPADAALQPVAEDAR